MKKQLFKKMTSMFVVLFLLFFVFCDSVYGMDLILSNEMTYASIESERDSFQEDIMAEKTLNEPLSEENIYVLECTVEIDDIQESSDVKEIFFEIENNGIIDIKEWSIVFEAQYDILSVSNVSLALNDGVKQLVSCENVSVIESGDIQNFSFTIQKDAIIDNEFVYRVYGQYQFDKSRGSVDVKECMDYITYDAETGESYLTIVNEEDFENVASTHSSEKIVTTKDSVIKMSANSRQVIGTDERIKISTTTVSPYTRIAFLLVTFPDGTKCAATGFMIDENHMLTSAHVVYNSKYGGKSTSVVAYFGANGTTYNYKRTASKWSYAAAYSSAPSAASDWAVLTFSSNIGNSTGWFSLGYTSDIALEDTLLCVCGYPADKTVTNANGINGKERYMYLASSDSSSLATNIITYTADTFNGQSGSPVYASTTKIVYGIHSRGNSSSNSARRITQSLYNSFVSNGWINE